MKTFFLLALLSILTSPAISQEPLQHARQIIAVEWLKDLCVFHQPDIDVLDISAVRGAFDQWMTADAQSDCSSSSPVEASKPKAANHRSLNTTDNIRENTHLIPNLSDRLLRMTEFQAEFQQTPDYVYGIREGSAAGTVSSFLANTDHKISSYGGPLHLDELFIPADTRVALCEALGAHSDKPEDKETAYAKSKSLYQNHCADVEYLTTARMSDRFARLGSAITLTIKVAQVPKFQSGILISSSSTAGNEKWSPTITGSFDSSKLYRSLAETKSLAGHASALPRLGGEFSKGAKGFSIEYLCKYKSDVPSPEQVSKCIDILALGGHVERSLLWLLPTISVKVTTPFDLAKYGNVFQAPPNHGGRSLYDASLTWNLHRVIPSATDRITALTSLDAMHNAKKEAARPVSVDRVAAVNWKRQVKALYIEMLLTPAVCVDETWWTQFRRLVLDKPSMFADS